VLPLPPPPPLPLAHGELTEKDAAELRGLKGQIQQRVGVVCEGYKEKCLRRRLAVRMRARGVHGYGQYAALLETDESEYARLVDAITINVSKLYRNPEVWEATARIVLPELARIRPGPIRIWSAGTAGGEEAYTLALLVLDHGPAVGLDPGRVKVLGTDVDVRTLQIARAAEYGPFAFTEIPEDVRERWFEGPERTRVRAEARRMVEFRELDLMRDPYPGGQHLIVCRNVIIYFERVVQEAIFQRFHESLAPEGFLLLGKVEALFGPVAGAFRTLANRERLFQRL
jgi:chemotaxis methyl-accepting protein methylase